MTIVIKAESPPATLNEEGIMYLSEREVKAIRARVRKHAEENANSTSGLLLDILSLTSSRRWSVVILQRGFSNARARMYRENLYEEQRQVIQCAERLKRRGLLKIEKKAGKIEASLTKKGLERALREAVRVSGGNSDEWCFVSYDVPEQARTIRARMRFILRSAGFEPIHKSLWYKESDVADIMAAFVRESGLDPWMKVLKGTKVI
ncbi:MAG: hypothetical protein AAB570_03995 [Patescibacteria group bacterium]